MIKHIFSALLVVVGVSYPASLNAITVNASPGSLSEAVSSPATITELTVTGSINAADMRFIADEMPALQSLNLGAATIAEYNGELIGTSTRHAADYIPVNIFAGAPFATITLPSSPSLKLGAGAFAGAALSQLTIPANVTSVGDGCFAGCPNLKSVIILGKTAGKGVFSGCTNLEMVTFIEPVAVPDDFFYNCTALKSITGPAFTAIGNRAFCGAQALRFFPFYESLASIGNEAFMGAGLEDVNLSECSALTAVGDWAFARMPRLTSLRMGNVSSVGQGIAFGCPLLIEVSVGESVTEIPAFAFSKSSISGADALVPKSVEYIGPYALSGLSEIEVLNLPSSLTMIDDHAMENMTGLKKITTDLYTVPDLGEDVWAGVSQKDVKLIVSQDMVNSFKSADQWCEFDVVTQTSDQDDIVIETLTDLRGRFDGDNLTVEASNIEISRIALYNPSGTLLVAVEPDSESVTIDTAGFGTRLYIVHATLTDGRTAVLKLAKR